MTMRRKRMEEGICTIKVFEFENIALLKRLSASNSVSLSLKKLQVV